MHIGRKDKDEEGDNRKTLEEEVDAMMDPKRPDAPDRSVPDDPTDDLPGDLTTEDHDKPKVSAVSAPASPARTAPELSDDLRRKIGVRDGDTKPLSIDKLDEITDKISKEDEPDEPDTPDEPEKPAGPAKSGKRRAAPQKELDEDSTDLDDARTEEAVEDIVSHEGDVVLAVEDATRKERNPELKASKTAHKKGGHRVLATILWTLVLFVAIVAVLFLVLLVTGGDVTAR